MHPRSCQTECGCFSKHYDPETKPMVVFNDKTVTVHTGDAIFVEMAAYKPARWKYRQR